MEAKRMEITPQIAERILSKQNGLNRTLRKSHVRLLADEMLSGNWLEFSGETIKFDIDKKLIDGQHRLAAVILYGEPITFDVVYNLEKKVYHKIDQGLKRNGADILNIHGVKNCSSTAAIIKGVLRLRRNEKIPDVINDGYRRPSNSNILREYDSAPDYWDGVTLLSKRLSVKKPNFMSGSQYGIWCHRMNHFDRLDSETFLTALASGEGEGNDPIFKLYKILLLDKMKPNMRFQKNKVNALIIKAWNLYRVGKKVKTLNWNPKTEDMPVLK